MRHVGQKIRARAPLRLSDRRIPLADFPDGDAYPKSHQRTICPKISPKLHKYQRNLYKGAFPWIF